MFKSFNTHILQQAPFFFLLLLFQSLSRVWLFATRWTVAHQAPLPMGFSRQEYRSGLPLSSPGDLPRPGTEPTAPALAGGFFTLSHLGSLFFFWCLQLLLGPTPRKKNKLNQEKPDQQKANSPWCPNPAHPATSLPDQSCFCSPTRLLCPWDSPGKNTGVGCHFFLQGIFPTQVSCIADGFFIIWDTREAWPLWDQIKTNYRVYDGKERL